MSKNNKKRKNVKNPNSKNVRNSQSEAVKNLKSEAVRNSKSKTAGNLKSETVKNSKSKTVRNSKSETAGNLKSETVKNSKSKTVKNNSSNSKKAVNIKIDKTIKKDIIRTTLILLIICVATTVALAGTNLLTEGEIKKQNENSRNSTMEKLLPAKYYDDISGGNEVAYRAITDDGGSCAGYVFISEAPGYGGDVLVMTALDEIGAVIRVEVTDCTTETPGLGQKAGTDDAFTGQFIGKSNNTAVEADGGEIDALTGATITSRAVSNAVNKAFQMYNQYAGGGQ